MEPASSAEPAPSRAAPKGELAARIVTVVVAGLVLLPNLAFPYSEDGGSFAAIARLHLEGLALYRELFDQKPPAIFLQESLRIALLGISPIAARVFELALLLASAYAFRGAVRPFLPRERAEAGGNAATLSFAIATSSAFWGILERGMVEVYQAAAIAVALGALGPILEGAGEDARRSDTARAALAGGALAWASWLKPQALVLVVVAAGVLAFDRPRERPARARRKNVVALLAAVALVSLPIVASMVVRGELRAFLWTMTDFNAAYVASARGKPAAAAKLLAIWEVRGGLWFLFVAVPGLGLVALRAQRRLLPVPALVLLVAVAVWSIFAFASGAFLFPYQSLVAVPVIALLFALSVEAAACGLGRLVPRAPRAAEVVVLAVVVALAVQTARFRRAAGPFARWIAGGLSTDAMHATLGTSGFFRYGMQREAARVVEARTAPDETFYVFGRAGVTYLFAHRRPASRQLATVIAYWPERTARLFHDELVRDLTTRPPKLLLVRIDDAMPWFGVDVPSSSLLERDPELAPFVARRYRAVGRIDDGMIVLERCPGEACPGASEQHGPAHGPG